MSMKKTVLASLLVSCFALSTIVEARGGTGGNGGNRGSAGRSDGSGYGGYGGSSSSSSGSSSGCSSCGGYKSPPQESFARSSYRGYSKHGYSKQKQACPVASSPVRGSRATPRDGHGGDLIRKGNETRDRDVDHDHR